MAKIVAKVRIVVPRLDPNAIQRVSGPAWESIRPQITAVHESLIGVSLTARGELATSYVKYLTDETASQPFAVLWLNKSTELWIGLALPDGEPCAEATECPGKVYKGLTAYLRIAAGDPIPKRLSRWAALAYRAIREARQTEHP